MESISLPLQAKGVHQLPQTLYWASLDSSARDTVLVFPGRDLYPWTLRGQVMSQRLPFGKVPQWATNGDQVAFGSAAQFEIQGFDRRGRLNLIVRWGAKPKPVAGPALDRFREEHAAFVRENPSAARNIPPADYFPVPDVMPAFARLLFDDQGNLWVRQYLHDDTYQSKPDEQAWWIFDPQGNWLSSLRTPAGFSVFGIQRGYVVGVLRDESALPNIQLYRVHRGK